MSVPTTNKKDAHPRANGFWRNRETVEAAVSHRLRIAAAGIASVFQKPFGARGRVEASRGGSGGASSGTRSFRYTGALAAQPMLTVPHPAHRTGRASLKRSALGLGSRCRLTTHGILTSADDESDQSHLAMHALIRVGARSCTLAACLGAGPTPKPRLNAVVDSTIRSTDRPRAEGV